jgi:hypothetical protein
MSAMCSPVVIQMVFDFVPGATQFGKLNTFGITSCVVSEHDLYVVCLFFPECLELNPLR